MGSFDLSLPVGRARTLRRTVTGDRVATAVLAATVLVLVLAAGLRLGRLDLIEFGTDESLWSRLAEDLVRLGRLPLVGPRSSQNVFAPPHFIYFLAPIVAVSRDPAVATAVIATVNVAAVGGAVWLGWRAFGPLAGLVAGGLYAVSPSAIFFSRKIWQPDLVAPPLAHLPRRQANAERLEHNPDGRRDHAWPGHAHRRGLGAAGHQRA